MRLASPGDPAVLNAGSRRQMGDLVNRVICIVSMHNRRYGLDRETFVVQQRSDIPGGAGDLGGGKEQ